MVCWGSNLQGQCTIPAGVSGSVLQGAAGFFHTLALLNDSTVRAWGYNFNGQTSVPTDLTNVTKIAAGAYHSLALKNNGAVVCWGAGLVNTGANNNWGQSMVPSDVKNVVEISGGGKHTVVRLGNGLIRSWGYNTSGQCNSPADYRAQSISAGFEFTVGMFDQSDLDSDGVVGYLDNCPAITNANQTDCDADGYGDICAIASSLVTDLDSNGVPDPCQYAYGDLDLDGEVGSGDVGLILLSIGESGDLIEDINNDNVVDSADVGLALLNYGPVP
jgi:alpha-tubulin suppressor-like RCC1 family protein